MKAQANFHFLNCSRSCETAKDCFSFVCNSPDVLRDVRSWRCHRINASFPVSGAHAHFLPSLVFAQDSLGITCSLHIHLPLLCPAPSPPPKTYALLLFRIVRRLEKQDFQIRKVMDGTVVVETMYILLVIEIKELFNNSLPWWNSPKALADVSA